MSDESVEPEQQQLEKIESQKDNKDETSKEGDDVAPEIDNENPAAETESPTQNVDNGLNILEQVQNSVSDVINAVVEEQENSAEEPVTIEENAIGEENVEQDSENIPEQEVLETGQVVEDDALQPKDELEVENPDQPEISVDDVPPSLQDLPTEEVQEKNITDAPVSTEVSAQVVHSEPTVVEADEEELLHRIPDDFYYDYHELVTKPKVSENSEIPESLLTLHHSFGYDCTKRANLHLLDEDHLLFSAGSLVVVLSMKLRKHTYLKVIGGGSVGAITVHPQRKYFVVAEKGKNPDICIYEYPSLKLYRILREGTEESYSFVTFDPTGEMLASLGGKPDYMLTIWNWRHEHITLRCKAFSQEIFRVSFSNDLEGILTTAGQGHIRFWKMARTFTGLKLQGEIGRFGKTELSDIEGYVELPDGKVLSGCESGNMLLWDGGLIKVQIGKKNRRPCHVGAIQQFIMDEGELLTVGTDGFIRVWDFETIDQAEAPDEGAIFEMDSMNELLVRDEDGSVAMLKWMIKALDGDSLWYAQDADGGIWRLDLSFSHTTKPPEKMFSFHAGAINGLGFSPLTDLVTTTGNDKTVRVYDYVTKHQLCVQKFSSPGTCIQWLPTSVDPKGSSIIAGFGDGVLRVMKITKRELDLSRRSKMGSASFTLTQVLKPHNANVTALEFNPDYTYLVSGSSDKTIFFFSVGDEFKLNPIGYISISCAVQQLQLANHLAENRLLVIGDDGRVADLVVPEPGSVDSTKTFQISGLATRNFRFKSIKDHLGREKRRIIREEERKARREKRRKDRQKKIDRGLIDPEKEPEEPDSEEEPDPEEGVPLFIPETYKINSGFYSMDGTKFWLTMSGFDAGFLYECDFAESESAEKSESYGEPQRWIEIPAIDDMPISFYSQCTTANTEMILFGLENGKLRIQLPDNVSNPENPIYFDDLKKFWVLPMHDIDMGALSAIRTSSTGKFLVSAGRDGNLYVFTFLPPDELEEAMAPAKLPSPRPETVDGEAMADELSKLEDIKDPKAYSIEDAKQKAELDRLLKLAEEKKVGLKKKVQEMRRQFKKLLLKNGEIAQHLQLHRNDFELDPESKIMLSNDTLGRMDMAKTEYAWDSEKQTLALTKLQNAFKSKLECDSLVVKCIGSDSEVASFRSEKLPIEFRTRKLELMGRAAKVGGLLGAARHTISQQKADQEASDYEDDPEKDDSPYSVTESPLINQADFEQPPTPQSDHVQSQTGDQEDGSGGATGGGGSVNKPGTEDKSGKVDEKAAKALGKMEKQRQRRLARQRQWEELYKEKPSDDFEDPRDVAEIKYALEHIGDFKLKTAANYVVPEHLRMNTARKLVQLMLLQEKMYSKKRAFNERLLALKFKKSDVLAEIDELNSELESIHRSLRDVKMIKRAPDRPSLVKLEKPEELYHYNRDKLIKFQREKASKDKSMAMAVASAFTAQTSENDQLAVPLGGKTRTGRQLTRPSPNLSGFFQPSGSSFRSPSPTTISIMESGMGGSGKPSSATTNQVGDGTGYKRPTVAPDTTAIPRLLIGDELLEGDESEASDEREESFSSMQQKRLLNKQGNILSRIAKLASDFDEQVLTLRAEKFNLQVDLKRADLRNTTLFEEFVQLKEFEKRENMLAGKVNDKYDEKVDMEQKVADCKARVETKRVEIERLEEKQKNLLEEFKSNLGENNKWEEFLTKVFKKKIKRAKKKERTGEEGEEDEEEEDEESDSDESDSDEDDFDEDEDETRVVLDDSVCPPGCEQELYDMACSLREIRLDTEEMLGEEKKTFEIMKKDAEAMAKKTKVIDHSLAAAEKDLEDFQVEKQGKLNQLQIIVVLKLHQIEYLISNVLPNDLSEALVFERNGLLRLQTRIHELNDEKVQQNRKQKENKLQNVQLKKGRKMLSSKIQELSSECDQMMLLKFGRTVDLERLEMVTVNRLLEELKEKYRQTELFCDREIQQWDGTIQQQKENITMLTRDNTRRINQMTMLLGEQKVIEDNLNAKQKKLGGEYEGKRKADIRERERLIQLVQLQSQEIEALKEEITLLSRKGGHILPPAQPPMPINQT
ncbi:cilia- and flagella-associated protein 44-like isoform X3 [Convolutriloba macropyga]|uniref:cilia- and flagella-associated protein 44-like isoform X3 n=1 Tax=Convolutriloba macropyga TaxID=536237 RepID=UPI003F523B3B